MQNIKIGTRGSQLALYQAYQVKNAIEENIENCAVEIVIIKTKGDKILDVALSKIGDKGLFTKEIEVSLLANEVDIAVHSLKDLPTVFVEGLILGAVLERADIRDAFVSRDGRKLDEFTASDKIATSSLRRKAQLLKYNPDFQIIDIRGNMNSRLKKMDDGYCDAMIMAGAGLIRLDFDDRITEMIDPEVMIPAVSQGAIAIQIRDNDPQIAEICNIINHKETFATVNAERIFLRKLEGGCQIPVGAWSQIENGILTFTGFVSNLDGSVVLKEVVSAPISEANDVANEAAQRLIDRGALDIVYQIRDANIDS